MSDRGDSGKSHVAALDVGSTSVRCFIVNQLGRVVGSARANVPVLSPGPGLEEIDPDEIWEKSVEVIKGAIASAGLTPQDILGLGICTQRGTFTTWNRTTGKHFHNFVTWRDSRASQIAEEINNSYSLKLLNWGGSILRWLTGLPKFIAAAILRFHSNYAAVLLAYMLKNNPALKTAVTEHNACFGTLDSYLLHRFTGGKVHAMEFSCAASTCIFDPFLLKWSDIVINLLQLPKHIFPEVLPTTHDFGATEEAIFGSAIPICCMIGDQSASLFGSCAFDVGDVKLTLGTGGFLSVNTGPTAFSSMTGIYPICAWSLGRDQPMTYGAEGRNLDTGTVIQWAVAAGLVSDPAETESLAKSVPASTSERLFFIPAFCGIEAPVKDSQAAAGFIGLLPCMRQAHMVRAILDSVAYRAYQLFSAMEKEAQNYLIATVKVDGGVSQNGYIMQLLADLCGRRLICSEEFDLTALGTAYLVGIHKKLWNSPDDVKRFYKPGRIYEPDLSNREEVLRNYKRWEVSVSRFLSWYSGDEREETLRRASEGTQKESFTTASVSVSGSSIGESVDSGEIGNNKVESAGSTWMSWAKCGKKTISLEDQHRIDRADLVGAAAGRALS